MAYETVTKDNLEALIADSKMLVIDFWASWCGPCKAFGPIFEKVSEKHPDITFAKCDTEEEREVAGAFDVRSIPTLAIFREQVLLFKEAGAFPEHMLEEVLTRVQSLDMKEVLDSLDAEEKSTEDTPAPEGKDGE